MAKLPSDKNNQDLVNIKVTMKKYELCHENANTIDQTVNDKTACSYSQKTFPPQYIHH